MTKVDVEALRAELLEKLTEARNTYRAVAGDLFPGMSLDEADKVLMACFSMATILESLDPGLRASALSAFMGTSRAMADAALPGSSWEEVEARSTKMAGLVNTVILPLMDLSQKMAELTFGGPPIEVEDKAEGGGTTDPTTLN